jgi:hypothetical protein
MPCSRSGAAEEPQEMNALDVGDVMEDAHKRRLKRTREWARRLGLSVGSLRTRKGVIVAFYIRDKQDRVMHSEEHGLMLDEIEKELLKREKTRLPNLSNVKN